MSDETTSPEPGEVASTAWSTAAHTVSIAPARCLMYRQTLGLSLRDAAEQMAVPHSTLARFEAGENVGLEVLGPVLWWLHENRDDVVRKATNIAQVASGDV